MGLLKKEMGIVNKMVGTLSQRMNALINHAAKQTPLIPKQSLVLLFGQFELLDLKFWTIALLLFPLCMVCFISAAGTRRTARKKFF
jgi:hypothetical protein